MMDKKGMVRRTFAIFFIISILLLVQFVLGLGGSGTIADPYQITNCLNLNETRDSLASYYILTGDIDCSDTVNWNNSAGFEPIATFTGNLDGQNNVITGLFINRSTTNQIGLFGYISGANISNVGLTGAYIRGYNIVGGLAGANYYYSYIDNSYVKGRVVGNSVVGGLVGYNYYHAYIDNSYAEVNVTGADYSGGLVGINKIYEDGSAVIDNSYATGNVTSTGSNVGGLVGYNHGYYGDGYYGYATIDNSYATGDVASPNGNYVGGLVGRNYGDNDGGVRIDNSYATGTVIGNEDVGGLVGKNYWYVDINNSYATGDVFGTGGNNVGGLVGYNEYYANIDNSYATGYVDGDTGDNTGGLLGTNKDSIINKSYATGNVTSTGNNVGGLVGYGYGYNSYSKIDNSYATGKVNGVGNVGGLVGYNHGYYGYATIDNSYSTGNVTATGDSSGGLVGYNDGSSTIDNSFATGSVSSSGNYIGGLVGYNDGTIDNSYWYNDTSDDADICIGEPAGSCTGKAATISYFFDISNVPLVNWTFPPWDTFCDDSGYPSLDLEGINNVADCRGYVAADITNPTWDELPADQTINYNQVFIYDLNASDDTAVESYSVNDTTNFAINSSGHLLNNTILSLGGVYGLSLTINDTSGNENTTSITITVKLINTSDVSANTSTIIDLSAVDSNITLYIEGNVNTTITVLSESPSPNGTTASLNFLKAIDIEVNNETIGNLTWALIKLYYNDSELTAANIDETTLKIYYYNETAADWQLEPNQGVDTANNYVWANMTHFSLFGAFGSAPSGGGGGSTGGGSSGGGVCEPTWVCTAWSSCINGEQTRICTDKWNCETNGKPSETQSCSVEIKQKTLEEVKEAKEIAEKEEEATLEKIKQEKTNTWQTIILAAVLTMLIISLILGSFYYFKRKKVIASEELENVKV